MQTLRWVYGDFKNLDNISKNICEKWLNEKDELFEVKNSIKDKLIYKVERKNRYKIEEKINILYLLKENIILHDNKTTNLNIKILKDQIKTLKWTINKIDYLDSYPDDTVYKKL